MRVQRSRKEARKTWEDFLGLALRGSLIVVFRSAQVPLMKRNFCEARGDNIQCHLVFVC